MLVSPAMYLPLTMLPMRLASKGARGLVTSLSASPDSWFARLRASLLTPATLVGPMWKMSYGVSWLAGNSTIVLAGMMTSWPLTVIVAPASTMAAPSLALIIVSIITRLIEGAYRRGAPISSGSRDDRGWPAENRRAIGGNDPFSM